MRRVPKILIGSVAFCAVAIACGDPGDEASRRTSLRAAGVVGCDSVRTSPEPVFVVGTAGTPSEAGPWFGSLDDAVVSEDAVYVADAERRLLHAFDLTGSHLWSTGGQGAGPGEYEWIGRIQMLGDTLVVYDLALDRFTFLSDSSLIGTLPLPEPLRQAGSLLGIFPDRSMVWVDRTANRAQPPTLYRDTAYLARYDVNGNRLADLGAFRGTERYVDLSEGFSIILRPFGRRASFARLERGIVAASGDSPDLLVISLEGDTSAVIATGEEERVVTPDMVRELEGHLVAGARNPASMRRLLDDIDPPEATPALSRVVTDATGAIWVEAWSLPLEPRRYAVFDAQGRWLEEVSFDGDLTVLDATVDLVVARTTDELGVDRLAGLPRQCFRPGT